MNYFSCVFFASLLMGLSGLSLTSCGHAARNSFTITGDIKGLKDTLVYLRRPAGDSLVVDSTVATGGKFQFTGVAAEPSQVYLATKERYIPLFLENADIRVEGNADSLDHVRISGSASQAVADSLAASMKSVTDAMDKEIDVYDVAVKAKDTARQAIIEGKMDSIRVLRRQAMMAFIRTHPSSPVSLENIQSMTYSGSYPELESLFMGLDSSIRGSQTGQRLERTLAFMKRREVGEMAMDFTQTNLAGQPVRFSDYRKGKYVLLDFWASWCGPCRAENPNVLRAYNEYKGKHFVVLGVSLDEDSARWRKAVAKDGMPWMQVSDLKGWKNEVAQQYGIQAIPFNFLVDTSGTIIAKNLRGMALEKELAEVLD